MRGMGTVGRVAVLPSWVRGIVMLLGLSVGSER